ncbi:MAG: hypothetical protein EOP88_13800 [Verrucomicrobiaceae bacterium]|nr:MAG: hypothetical protein EOP88_13800 [Verrucomicrobiaceae bacterium]
MPDPETNPYMPPSSGPSEGSVADGPAVRVPGSLPDTPQGRPCEKCGSTNTGAETALRSRPSVIAFLLFSWLLFLIRAAFIPRTDTCRDCGAQARYRTPGNNLAMAALILLVLMIALSWVAEMDPHRTR